MLNALGNIAFAFGCAQARGTGGGALPAISSCSTIGRRGPRLDPGPRGIPIPQRLILPCVTTLRPQVLMEIQDTLRQPPRAVHTMTSAVRVAVTAAFGFYISSAIACYSALGNGVPGMVLQGFEGELCRRLSSGWPADVGGMGWLGPTRLGCWLVAVSSPKSPLLVWAYSPGFSKRLVSASLCPCPCPTSAAADAPEWILVVANICIVIHMVTAWQVGSGMVGNDGSWPTPISWTTRRQACLLLFLSPLSAGVGAAGVRND